MRLLNHSKRLIVSWLQDFHSFFFFFFFFFFLTIGIISWSKFQSHRDPLLGHTNKKLVISVARATPESNALVTGRHQIRRHAAIESFETLNCFMAKN